MNMKHHIIIITLALFTAGCVSTQPKRAAVSFTTSEAAMHKHPLPSELLVVRVEVDGRRVTSFEARVACDVYGSDTGWLHANKNGEVLINYGQSDHRVSVLVHSTAPTETFVAATYTVRPNTLPPTPLTFALHTKKQ
jgi:hypothetical protein